MLLSPAASFQPLVRQFARPVLLLIGENEVIYDAAEALGRARRLIPDFEGELVPRCSHDMVSSQHEQVDARVLGFLSED